MKTTRQATSSFSFTHFHILGRKRYLSILRNCQDLPYIDQIRIVNAASASKGIGIDTKLSRKFAKRIARLYGVGVRLVVGCRRIIGGWRIGLRWFSHWPLLHGWGVVATAWNL